MTSREFRCFVIRGCLVAISQRDDANFYPDLTDDTIVAEVCDAIEAFFRRCIVDNFPDPDYVFDVCLNEDGQVFLLDFNPFSPVTDSLLFTWPELYDLHSRPNVTVDRPEFRVRRERPPMAPASTMPYGFPKDLVRVESAQDIEEFAQLAESLRPTVIDR